MLGYPARIRKDGDGYVVSFPDIPEALSGGRTREGAIAMAHDALMTAMDFYFEDRRVVPLPSKAKRGQVIVALPASIGIKVLLLNEMIKQNVRPSELARRMKTRPQDVNRLTDLRHATKIDTVASAFASMGKTLEWSVS